MLTRTLAIAGTLSFALAASAAAQDFQKDRMFLLQAIQGENAEIKLGELGERKATAPAARSLAEALARGRFGTPTEARRLAARLHLAVPLRGTSEGREARGRLSALKGAEFDRAFVGYVADEDARAVSEFAAVAVGTDAAADLARKTLPVLKQRLELARETRRKLES